MNLAQVRKQSRLGKYGSFSKRFFVRRARIRRRDVRWRRVLLVTIKCFDYLQLRGIMNVGTYDGYRVDGRVFSKQVSPIVRRSEFVVVGPYLEFCYTLA